MKVRAFMKRPACQVVIVGFALSILGSIRLSASENLTASNLLKNSSAVVGTVTNLANCKDKTHQVWLSQGSTLLYQTNVPTGGSFEFHLIPGSYLLMSTSEKGCFSEKKVTVQENKIVDVLLKAGLAKADQKRRTERNTL
jgi:hypothetical protein